MISVMPDPEAPILVVDDDPKIVALVRTYLERERYQVVIATDGLGALLLVDHELPATDLEAAGAVIAFARFRSEALHEHADVVFPAEIYPEKEGTVTHPDGRLQRIRQALGRANQVRPTWQVLAELCERVGAGTGVLSAPMVTTMVAESVPFYAGITLDEIGGLGVRWQEREAASALPVEELSTEELHRIYPEQRLPQVTSHSISRRSDLEKQLDKVRRLGYATNREESEEGVASVAVSIPTQAPGLRLAINAAAPVGRAIQPGRLTVEVGDDTLGEGVAHVRRGDDDEVIAPHVADDVVGGGFPAQARTELLLDQRAAGGVALLPHDVPEEVDDAEDREADVGELQEARDLRTLAFADPAAGQLVDQAYDEAELAMALAGLPSVPA